MSFDADARLVGLKTEHPDFDFTWEGSTYVLPNPWLFTPAELEALTGLNEDDEAEVSQVMEALAPEPWAAVRSMPPVLQGELVQAWREHCGIEDDEEGKGRSPSSARNRAERRSQQTSKRAKAKTSGRSRSTKQPAGSAS